MTEHPILIAPEEWRNSKLSIAELYGGIIFNVRTYMFEPMSDSLVMREFWKLLPPKGALGMPTLVRLAKKPYDEQTALDIAKRLSQIIKCRRTEGIKEEAGVLL